MNEQHLQHHHPPPPSLPRPPASFTPGPMPAPASQPDAPPTEAPQLSPAPAPDPSPSSTSAPPPTAPEPQTPSSSSSPLPIANPKREPSAATGIVVSATDPGLPTATATEPALPTKIPCRPRKTRKLAAPCSAAAQGRAADAAAAAASPDGDGGTTVAAATAAEPVVNNHTRAVYYVPPRPLSAEGEVVAAVRHLRVADPQLAELIDAHKPPVFHGLHSPFHALARSILYQQLALKAAASIYSRFLALCGGEGGVSAQVVLGLTPHQLRQIGVSARKASYLHDLANKYRGSILSDASITAMDDKSLFTMLNMVKGIGAWSVHMFMIFSLHRPDVLPVGDVGVRKGVQLLYGLDGLPRPSQMEQLCERWRRYRSVGSWYMWRLVEAKGMPAALATVSSGGAVAADADGGGVGGGASLAVAVPPPFPPQPPLLQATPHLQPPPHLQLQIQQQQHSPQHQHLQQHQRLHPPQHPHPHQHQHQRQLQMRPQLIDAIQSIPNLG